MLTPRKRRYIKGIFVTVFIAAAAVSFLLPTVFTIANSFMSSTELTANYGAMLNDLTSSNKGYVSKDVNLSFIPERVTFSQYRSVLITDPEYLEKFWNSVLLTVPITFFQVALAVLTAYGFSRYNGKVKGIIFFVYIILLVMPYQVTLVPNYIVAKKFRLLDRYLSIILPAVFSPFSVFLLTKVMRRIPVSYVEAAKLDGAGELRILTGIYIPLCRPSIISVAMLVFIDYWNMIEQPLIMISDRMKHPLSVFLSQINTKDVGLAFAVGTVYMVPTVLMFLYGEDYLIEGMTYSGGIKG